MRFFDQLFDVGERHPGILAAGGAPALDRLEDRLGSLTAERPVDVDDQERRALAKAGAGAKPAGGEHRPVALGQKLVPDALAHHGAPALLFALSYRKRSKFNVVIPGRGAAASPETIFQKPVFMGSGPRLWRSRNDD